MKTALLLAVTLAACGGSSPSSPSADIRPTPTPAPTAVPTPANLWGASGTGANVFSMPTYIRRVKIDGAYGGFCENFIVRIAGRTVVNEILGNCSVGVGRDFTGTYATTGGQVEVTNSTGVLWTFTDVR
jgi:hypothetical protein